VGEDELKVLLILNGFHLAISFVVLVGELHRSVDLEEG
jgi:hypothetical protein